MRPPTGCPCWFALAVAVIGPAAAFPQVKSPKPPDAYDAHIRYRIDADRNERVLQYEAMTKFFASVGFKETENDDNDLAAFDPAAQIMDGAVPSKSARRLLEDRRVQTLLLYPAGFKLPEDGQQRVRIQVELAANQDQTLLAKQVDLALNRLGFRRDLGFDTRRETLIRGSIPARNVPKLVRDLRNQPSGWFMRDAAPELSATLPDGTAIPGLASPFADANPVRVVEVIGVAEAAGGLVVLPPIPADRPHVAKWTADLRRRLAAEGAMDSPIRLELVLASEPDDLDYEWRERLIGVGAAVEGRVGPVVTVAVGKGSIANDIALMSSVVSVRLPRRSTATVAEQAVPKAPPKGDDPKVGQGSNTVRPVALRADDGPVDVLKAIGLDRLHSAGKRGQGVRVVIIDTDFAGWEAKLGAGRGSAPVRFVDLTAERNRTVLPDPMAGDFGHGTHCALAVRLAAPAAELTLVRIPADAPYQLVNVSRAIRGDTFRSEGVNTRRREIAADFDALRIRRAAALDEYRKAFDNFDAEEAAQKRRIAAQQALKKLDDEERAVQARHDRLEELELAINRLSGSHIVLNELYWNTGFALDGASPTSRFLDEWLVRRQAPAIRSLTRRPPPPPALWFQPAGDTGGQSWSGVFRDVDQNGVMEFATTSDTLPADRWSRELNFLARRASGKDAVDLPAGAKVRVSVQWREPHDPTLSEFDYRVPVTPLKLQLVKQRDPSGEKYSSDEIDLVAESEGMPERLQWDPAFGVYEHSLEVTLPAAGRYALRVEGRVPNHVRPLGTPVLPGQEVRWELRPRVFVEDADGRADFVLADFASADGGVAVPADARTVIAVGAVGPDGSPRAFSASGAGPTTGLAVKPDLLAPDTFPALGDRRAADGTSLSAAFAAGWAATLRSAGVQSTSIPHGLGRPPRSIIAVPRSLLER